MSAPDGAKSPLINLATLPKDEEGPVFAEPWQAQVFSVVHMLLEKGHVTATEWADMLGAVIREMPDDTPYYQSWLMALERISVKKDLVHETLLHERKNEWERAARATPHGQPIKLQCE